MVGTPQTMARYYLLLGRPQKTISPQLRHFRMYAQQLRDRAGIPSSEAAFGSDGKPRNVFPRDGKALAGTLDAIAVVHDPEGRVRFPVAARDAIGRPAPFTALHSHRNRNPSPGSRNKRHLRALRALFGLVAFFDGTAPRIRKSSADFPPLIAAVNHFGLNPRPAHVSSGFCGLRYFGGTGPLSPNPEPFFRSVLAP
jgi:hypothetical protein